MASITKVIRKSGTRWRIRLRDGQGGWITKTFMTMSEARATAAEIENSLATGKYAKPDRRTLSDYLVEIESNYPKAHNKALAARLLKEWLGGAYLQNIGKTQVAEVYKRLLEKPHRHGGKISIGSANRIYQAMRSIFSDYVRDGLIEINPFAGRKLKSENNIRSRILTPAEMPRFLKALESRPTQFQLLVQLALSTGARAGELLNLTWADIDVERNFILLRHTKNGKPRTCGLFPEIKAQLLAWRKETKLPDPHHRVIVSGDQNVVYDYKGTWLRLMAELGTEDLWFHDLRRTVGSYLAMNGASQRELQDALGHLSPAMAARYAHLTERHVHSLVASVMGGVLVKV